MSFAPVNLQLYLLEHPGVYGNDPKKFTDLMTRTIKLSRGGNCSGLAAEQILGPELGNAFLAETASDLRHMQLWVSQCCQPKTLLLLGPDQESSHEDGTEGAPEGSG